MPRNNKQWTGKSSAFKLLNKINGYLDEYIAMNQSNLKSQWFKQWYSLFHTAHIGGTNIYYQLAAHFIVGNPHATIIDSINKLMQSIPELNEYLLIHQVSVTVNVRYNLQPYNYTTPKWEHG